MINLIIDRLSLSLRLHSNAEIGEMKQALPLIPLSLNDSKILRIDDPLGLGD